MLKVKEEKLLRKKLDSKKRERTKWRKRMRHLKQDQKEIRLRAKESERWGKRRPPLKSMREKEEDRKSMHSLKTKSCIRS